MKRTPVLFCGFDVGNGSYADNGHKAWERWAVLPLGFTVHGIDGFEKRKAVKVPIAGADASDAVLAHENSGVCIVHDVP